MNKSCIIMFLAGITATFIGTNKLYAQPSDLAYINALEKVIAVVEIKKKETCDKAKEMRKLMQTARIKEQHSEELTIVEKDCQHKEDLLNTLDNGNIQNQLRTIKGIYEDPDVKAIIDKEEATLQSEQAPEGDALQHTKTIDDPCAKAEKLREEISMSKYARGASIFQESAAAEKACAALQSKQPPE